MEIQQDWPCFVLSVVRRNVHLESIRRTRQQDAAIEEPRIGLARLTSWDSSASFMPMMAMAADDGTFTIGEVAPGTYHINATANAAGPAGGIGAGSFEFVATLDGAASGPGPITVSSADITGLTVVGNRR
jgi:hypothetical protein